MSSRNSFLQTPLHIACENLHIKIVSILLKENPEQMIRAEDIDGMTALHYAVKSSRNQKEKLHVFHREMQKDAEEEVVQMLLRYIHRETHPTGVFPQIALAF